MQVDPVQRCAPNPPKAVRLFGLSWRGRIPTQKPFRELEYSQKSKVWLECAWRVLSLARVQKGRGGVQGGWGFPLPWRAPAEAEQTRGVGAFPSDCGIPQGWLREPRRAAARFPLLRLTVVGLFGPRIWGLPERNAVRIRRIAGKKARRKRAANGRDPVEAVRNLTVMDRVPNQRFIRELAQGFEAVNENRIIKMPHFLIKNSATVHPRSRSLEAQRRASVCTGGRVGERPGGRRAAAAAGGPVRRGGGGGAGTGGESILAADARAPRRPAPPPPPPPGGCAPSRYAAPNTRLSAERFKIEGKIAANLPHPSVPATAYAHDSLMSEAFQMGKSIPLFSPQSVEQK
ncbi:Protein of unknown function [Gryllus bimaculatus]|nr:Protein of unknown function [Gryllus bimaculatus]